MSTWSGIRHKLENEYLAESLRGHIQYYCTSYSKSPDHHGRASIRLDGKEFIDVYEKPLQVASNSFSGTLSAQLDAELARRG